MPSPFHIGAPPAKGRVTPLVDGDAYFHALAREMDRLKAGDILCLMKWHIDPWVRVPDFSADPDAPEEILLSRKLAELHMAGVEIRVLLWINTNILRPVYSPNVTGAIQDTINLLAPLPNMQRNAVTVPNWRNAYREAGLSDLADRLMVNTLDAFTGGCHAKFALVLRQVSTGVYEGTGFTGGLDLAPDRFKLAPHGSPENYWHDVQAEVRGNEAIRQMALYFEQMWNENIMRRAQGYNPQIYLGQDLGPEYDYGPFPAVPANADMVTLTDLSYAATPGDEAHFVQSLRTVPKIIPGFGEAPVSFAPDGAFEIRQALQHAIRTATRYIYIEDQAMESLEIFDMLRQALEDPARPDLQVIVFTGTADPADGPRKRLPRTLLAWYFFERLLLPTRKARFHFYEAAGYVVHSKLFLFDDVFAIIGSAGMFTRSLTQEGEHAVAVSVRDDIPADPADNPIVALRTSLWAEMLQVEQGDYETAVSTLDQALEVLGGPAVAPPLAAPGISLPVFATRIEQVRDTAIADQVYLPVIENGQLKTDTALQSEVEEVFEAFNLDANHPVEDEIRVFVRTLDWQPKIISLIGIEVAGQGYRVLYGKPVDPRTDGTEDIAATAPPTLTDNAVSDPRLVTEESNPALLSNGRRVAEEMGLLRVFYDHSIVLHCTSGANIGEVRRVEQNASGTLSVAALPQPDASSFSYELLYPKIRKVDLFRYRQAELSARYLFEATWHLLSHEVLFSSLLNEDKELPLAVPVPVGRPVAINEKVALKTLANAGAAVTWTTEAPDARPQTGSGTTFEVQFSSHGRKVVTAVQTFPDGIEMPFTFEVDVLRNSGQDWWEDFHPPMDIAWLEPAFQQNVSRFVLALADQSIIPNVISVYRPPERAYLMHYCFKIATGLAPEKIDERPDTVAISWKHYRADGTYDPVASIAAAKELAVRFGIYDPDPVNGRKNPSPPAYPSNHSTGIAVDIKFTWTGEKTVPRGDGPGTLTIRPQDLTKGVNDPARIDLSLLGKTYGVIRTNHKSNHWSTTGR